jgi:hypothetical protein
MTWRAQARWTHNAHQSALAKTCLPDMNDTKSPDILHPEPVILRLEAAIQLLSDQSQPLAHLIRRLPRAYPPAGAAHPAMNLRRLAHRRPAQHPHGPMAPRDRSIPLLAKPALPQRRRPARRQESARLMPCRPRRHQRPMILLEKSSSSTANGVHV